MYGMPRGAAGAAKMMVALPAGRCVALVSRVDSVWTQDVHGYDIVREAGVLCRCAQASFHVFSQRAFTEACTHVCSLLVVR